jgi:hypothetical protein
MTDALGLFNFIRGIANGTTLTSTPSLKKCEAAADSAYIGAT